MSRFHFTRHPYSSYGNRYYISASGNDTTGDGSVNNPWQTITKVNSLNLSPGDRVYFNRGDTFAGKLTPTISGNVPYKILYGAYGSGNRPIIDGSADKALSIPNSDAAFLRYEHLDFSGSINASQHVVNCKTHDLYMYDCVFRDGVGSVAGNGAGFYAWSTTGGGELYNITIDSCIAHDNDATGIFIGSSTGVSGPHDCTIINCTAYNNGTTLYVDHGIYVRHGVTIAGCISYNNIYGSGIKVNDEGVYDSPYRPIVYNCVSYGNHDGLTLDNVGSIIYNNLIYGNTYMAMPMTQSSSDCLIYFNTFVNTTSGGLSLTRTGASQPTGMVVKNNLFIQDDTVADLWILTIVAGSASLATIAGSNTFDYNIYFHHHDGTTAIGYDTASRTFATWQGYGADAHGALLTALPGFVTRYTDLHVANGGNLEGLGVAIDGYGIDKDGVPRQSPPTPGCYEVAA